MMFKLLLWVPAVVLFWRCIVSKQGWAVRFGAAATAMLTLVGSVTAPLIDTGHVSTYRLESVRDALALLAATTGPVYLLVWATKHRGRGRSKTLSIIAAIIGVVPIGAAIALPLFYPE